MTIQYTISDLIKYAVEHGASDIIINFGRPPMVKIHGETLEIPEHKILEMEDAKALVLELLDDRKVQQLEDEWDLDFAHIADGCRVRVNVGRGRGSYFAVLRIIPTEVKSLRELGLGRFENFAKMKSGLVLVTGATGSGKSTTLAALIDYVNSNLQRNIITIEHPIEFVHEQKSSVVIQREVHVDTRSFQSALTSVLRQAPDVILVGEMRDRETIQAAITAAETGHLVFGTLHSQSAKDTVDRIVDVFPSDHQNQIKTQLAAVLRGVISQSLIPAKKGGRVLCHEVMHSTSGIQNLIREGKTHQINGALQQGANEGMLLFDMHLSELVRTNQVDKDVALEHCRDRSSFNDKLSSASR